MLLRSRWSACNISSPFILTAFEVIKLRLWLEDLKLFLKIRLFIIVILLIFLFRDTFMIDSVVPSSLNFLLFFFSDSLRKSFVSDSDFSAWGRYRLLCIIFEKLLFRSMVILYVHIISSISSTKLPSIEDIVFIIFSFGCFGPRFSNYTWYIIILMKICSTVFMLMTRIFFLLIVFF